MLFLLLCCGAIVLQQVGPIVHSGWETPRRGLFGVTTLSGVSNEGTVIVPQGIGVPGGLVFIFVPTKINIVSSGLPECTYSQGLFLASKLNSGKPESVS